MNKIFTKLIWDAGDKKNKIECRIVLNPDCEDSVKKTIFKTLWPDNRQNLRNVGWVVRMELEAFNG